MQVTKRRQRDEEKNERRGKEREERLHSRFAGSPSFLSTTITIHRACLCHDHRLNWIRHSGNRHVSDMQRSRSRMSDKRRHFVINGVGAQPALAPGLRSHHLLCRFSDFCGLYKTLHRA